jgi:two-component system chemotaxis response regulator CheY
MTVLGAKKTILVVDDDPDICMSLEEIFNGEGYRVVIAKDGQVGLDMARAQQPDLVLLDVMMPVLDGYGFLDAQRADPAIADIPVIVLSAGLMLDRIPQDIPRLPKPPELLALFSLVESRINLPRKSKTETPAIDAPSGRETRRPPEALSNLA